MKLKSLVSCSLVAFAAFSAPAQAQVEIQWWHAMGGALGEWVNDLAKGYNESQKDYKVVPTFKGSYPETLTAGIAAFRSGNAPDILQVFEVGTATMMASKGAIVPVGKVMKDSGLKFDPTAYVPAVAGYYTAPNGQMLSMPFNSSTTIFYYNKDAFKAAGLDPDKAPVDLARGRARRGQAEGERPQVPVHDELDQLDPARELLGLAQRRVRDQEQRLGRHATRASPSTAPLHVRHIQNLENMAKQGLFVYKGRDNKADATFPSGECAMMTGSAGLLGAIKKNAKFAFGVAPLPYYQDVAGRAAEHRHRRRQPVGDVRQAGRALQGRGGVLQLPVEPRRAVGEPQAHRLPADHDRRPSSSPSRAASTRRTRAPTSRSTR